MKRISRNFGMIFAAAALVAGVGAAQAAPRLTGEARLAKMLEGRVAGPPVDCISLLDSQDTQIIDHTAIVYGSGRTIYVNRPNNARDLDSDDIMVTHPTGSQLCKLDAVHMRDRTSHMFSGFVTLEKFVPYRRIGSR